MRTFEGGGGVCCSPDAKTHFDVSNGDNPGPERQIRQEAAAIDLPGIVRINAVLRASLSSVRPDMIVLDLRKCGRDGRAYSSASGKSSAHVPGNQI